MSLFTKCPKCGEYSFLDRDCCTPPEPTQAAPITCPDMGSSLNMETSYRRPHGTIDRKGFAR